MMPERELKTLIEAYRQGGEVDVVYYDLSPEDAETIIAEIAVKLGRTYELLTDGQFRWFQVVNHEVDRVTYTAHIEEEGDEDEADESG